MKAKKLLRLLQLHHRLILRLILYAAPLIFFYWAPWSLIANGPVLCPFRRLFGIPCLGCGMTRAFWQIIHGHLETALSYNALAILFFPVLVWLVAWDIYWEIRI